MGKKSLLLPHSTAFLILSWMLFSSNLAACLPNLADDSSLLSLKAHITYDSKHILATNWSTTTHYCNWLGVSCGTSHQRVIALDLSNMGLQGTIPPQLGNLSSLVTLDLSNNSFHASIPNEIAKCKELQQLYLFNNELTGSIPQDIGNLSKLEELYLGGNKLTGSIPREISHLLGLKMLSFRNNNLTASIPSAIFNLSSLQYIGLTYNLLSGTLPMDICYGIPEIKGLYLSGNQLSGNIPTSLGKCGKLEEISLSFNEFTGSIPREIGNLSELEILYLGNNNLQGEIPQTLFNLSLLKKFELGSNNLQGILPADMCFRLPKLEVINHSENQLKGEIPTSLSNCGELQVLGLSLNQIIGRVPNGIGNLSGIEKIYLGGNNLIGSVPSSFGNLSTLKVLYLAENKIQGNIPKELGNLLNLQYLSFASNNLTGAVPEAIFNISKLQFLVLADNQLSGNLPSRIGTGLPDIEELLVGGNKFSGIIPGSISNLTKLIRLDLSYNFLTGYVPKDLGKLRLLQHLGFGNNQLSGEHSNSELGFLTSLSNCKFLRNLWIQDNPLKGTLPNSLGNLSLSLESINASACQFKGVIPEGIGNLTNLIELGLGDNELTGTIPTTLGKLQKLQRLYISGNRIQGSVPNDLCQLTNLVYLFLGSNKFSGLVPSCLGNLTALQLLFLDNNLLASKLPSAIWSLEGLLVLNLSSNFLNSNLTLIELGKMKFMTKLDLSKNQFSGHIPSSLGQLESLTELSLSKNNLQGSIPVKFGDLISLEYLDLSRNNLSGAIPKTLEALVYLKYLNLSFNQLQGEIPDGGPFKNFTAESFISNLALCGAPKFQVRSCDGGKSRKTASFLLKCILVPVIPTIICVAFIVVFIRRRQQNKLEIPAPVNSLNPTVRRRITHQELLYGTNFFSEDNLIGRGSLGMVHKGVLSDGMIVAVKVFNLEFQGAFKSFDAECEIMRNIRHRNLVKIISSCSILNFKALVLEYMPNGSLERWLYSHNYCLNLIHRLNTMIDVASALEYLHHGYSNPVVHCDLKPNNVLLDEDMVAHLGDFGISKLLTETESMEQTKTLGTIGYMAPEFGSEGLVSTKSDVYSYGIMLMEVFTRKKPTDGMFSGEVTLKRWVESLYMASRVMEAIDVNLVSREDEDFAIKESCICSIISLALDCTAELPKERINMKDVVTRLEKIRIKCYEDHTKTICFPP